MRLLKIYTTILFLLSFMMPVGAQADQPTGTVTIPLRKKPHRGNADPEGNRLPSAALICTISQEDGVQCGIPKEEIETYELWTLEGETVLLSTSDESEFIDYLFTMPPRDYMIAITTADYNFVGYIY